MKLYKGDVIEGVICSWASGGEGVLKTDGFPVFVPFALVGERIKARVTFAKKDCAFADLIEVITPSPDRVKPRCPYFGRCGGCDLQHATESLQLEIKRDSIKTALKKIAGIDFDVPLPIHLCDYGYRNKLSLPFSVNRHSGRVSLGFYEKRSHKVIPIKWCALNGQWAADVIEALSTWATRYTISVYDEVSGQGLLRHAVARKLSDLSLTLVINGDCLPRLDELCEALHEKFENFALYISVNKKRTNVIFGEAVSLVAGEERAQDLGQLRAKVSPKSFLQVCDPIRDALYDEVGKELSDVKGKLTELYSGVGLLTAQLALRTPELKIVSVEIEPPAVSDARALISSLGLSDRVECICADALDYMRELAGRGEGGFDAVLLDPPRRGCDREAIEAISKCGYQKIVYISCNPQTLARDVKLLSDVYELKRIQPFDMFAETAEVECLAILKRREKE